MRILILAALIISISGFAQTTKKVCFLGNSYTYYNDMPQIVADMATAEGNTLVKDQYTSGGFTLQMHSTNGISMNKISADTWDYVVLQDQSQLPSFPWWQVEQDVLPYAAQLCDSIRAANECAIPLFFNTWGRRDGDSQWDSINTFDKMNQRLINAYGHMADVNTGKRAPVAVGFNHVDDDTAPVVTHTDLYAGDGSHPSEQGSYLTACIFYEMIFETTCIGNTHISTGVSGAEATYLQNVAHHVVNDVDSVQFDFTQPFASFSYSTSGFDVTFTNESEHAFEYSWDFGDGSNSMDENPSHDYGTGGIYDVTLTSTYCGNSSDTTITIDFTLDNPHFDNGFQIVPNPCNGNFNVDFLWNASRN
jgi:hypothetical protein